MFVLLLISVVAGVGMLWVFRTTTNQAAVREAKRRIQAHLYELRLFSDEPLLMLKAQRGLLAANFRYISLMLAPALVMLIPMVLILGQLQCLYGYRPIQSGTAAVVNLGAESGVTPILQAPDGIVVETPAVHIDHEMSWRIRATRPVAGVLRFVLPGQTIEKTIRTGSGSEYVSERRVRSLLDWLWHPGESRLPAGPVNWIEVRYPNAGMHALGLDLDWLVWFILFSSATALLLKPWFSVTF
jgi:hypothetical protein